MRLVDKLIKAVKQADSAPFDARLAPETAFFAIGDIHGCADLLEDRLRQIDSRDPAGALPLVVVGDYVDRGPDSATVLRRLHELGTRSSRPVICLKGNHEDMLLGFLADPVGAARGWFSNGGDATLASFGLSAPSQLLIGPEVFDLREKLLSALGDDMLAWLQGLPGTWNSGNVWVVHAGADPGKPMHRQDDASLAWGHANFATQSRADGQWVVHGHTIMPEVTVADGRISIDTGAYATGQLSAVLISEAGVEQL